MARYDSITLPRTELEAIVQHLTKYEPETGPARRAAARFELKIRGKDGRSINRHNLWNISQITGTNLYRQRGLDLTRKSS